MINTRSGTRIAVSDTSIQDGVDRVYPPVLVGLEQALFLPPVVTEKTMHQTALFCQQLREPQRKMRIASRSRQ